MTFFRPRKNVESSIPNIYQESEKSIGISILISLFDRHLRASAREGSPSIATHAAIWYSYEITFLITGPARTLAHSFQNAFALVLRLTSDYHLRNNGVLWYACFYTFRLLLKLLVNVLKAEVFDGRRPSRTIECIERLSVDRYQTKHFRDFALNSLVPVPKQKRWYYIREYK